MTKRGALRTSRLQRVPPLFVFGPLARAIFGRRPSPAGDAGLSQMLRPPRYAARHAALGQRPQKLLLFAFEILPEDREVPDCNEAPVQVDSAGFGEACQTAGDMDAHRPQQ